MKYAVLLLVLEVVLTHSQCRWHGAVHGLFRPDTPHPRVIVTGGAGFIGRALVKRLRLTHGPGQVEVIDNLWRNTADNYPMHAGTDFCNVDLRNETATLQYIRGARTVYHMAEIVLYIPPVTSDRESNLRDNLLINNHVLLACKLNFIKEYIYGGTALQSTRLRRNIQMDNQTMTVEQESAARWTLLMEEHRAHLTQLSDTGILAVGLLRFDNVYGPGCDWSPAMAHAIPSSIHNAKRLPEEVDNTMTTGAGLKHRDFLYIEDVVDALLLVQHQGLNKGVIQIGSRQTITLNALNVLVQETIARKMDTSFSATSRVESDVRPLPVVGRAWQILNWKPNHTLSEGVSLTVDWMLQTKNQTAVASAMRSGDVLLIVIGTPRGGNVAWKSLHTHVLMPLQADLLIYFGKTDPTSEHNNISLAYWKNLHDMAQYVFYEQEHDDWGVVLDQASLGQDSRPADWLPLCKFGPQWLGGVKRGCNHQAGSAIQLGFKYLVQQKLISTGLINRYDNFIYSRADFLYGCKYPPISTLDAHSIWIPEGEDYGGLEDRHMVMSRANILVALNVTHAIMSEPNRWIKLLQTTDAGPAGWNPEKILLLYYTHTQGVRVRRFKHPAFLVKGVADSARWLHGDGSLLPPPLDTTLRVKYQNELRNSQDGCPSWTNNLEQLIRTSPREWFVFPAPPPSTV
eukprot:CAMPEP_0119103700 /NCGR_PEP_ID=MMETSP1180-20130426/2084_1 /TAXON_ID=3052 ORGANISM="Chlamydomonas cf sp, Strain CCMP681" /NCGR_SAMPLE_ID=MMETSP1180 /ASSEMBLY_ACC=CAM_ASM_000741 /LENGTH=682 /DNA_ID=CAMNT_0007088269 /DNA_START=215 /DNA_END=2263 /DNA_ORIENTATION=-